MRCWSKRPTEPIIRVANWVAPISIEKIATGKPEPNPPIPSAIFSAILIEKAVLPIDGRPATIIKSPPCNPEVIASKSVNPVGIPVTSD